MRIIIISDTHGSPAYLQRAREVMEQEHITTLFHLGDVGNHFLKKIHDFFTGIEIHLILGNHDWRRRATHAGVILHRDTLFRLGNIIGVAKELGRFPAALWGYKRKLLNLLHLVYVVYPGVPVVLLSHCGGKIACHKRFLRCIEGGHADAMKVLKPDLEIHGHKHPSCWGMYLSKKEFWPVYNTPNEGEHVWNAAMNILLLNTDTLEVESR